jgi:phenylacetate-coenzyme A ligase PaaK-like adenylate-forming protein
MKRTPLESWVSDKIGKGKDPLTRERIEHHQRLMLQETLAWARAKSSFYRRRLAGLSERALSGRQEFCRIPFTTAEDIRQNPLHFLCVSQSEINRVVTLHTSGTTGLPKRIYFTREDQELTVDFFHRGMSTLVGPGERVLILLPGERPGSVGDLLAAGLQRLGASSVVYGPVQDYAQALEVMVMEGFDALVGIPVQVLALARQSRGRAAPRSVLLSTDYVPDSIKKELHLIWGCEIYTHYGMTEMGFGGGVDCEARQGYHMREADLLFEVVDPKTGASLEEGEAGEVVFTTLTRLGMPLIRYRTGDLSRFLPEQCPCGTVLKTMAPVRGRIAGRMDLEPGIVLTIEDLDEALFPICNLIDFSAELTWEEDLNHLEIRATFPEGSGKHETESIHRALKGIPVLRSSIREARLKVRVTVREGNPSKLNGSVKRTITDKRNSGVV